MLTSLLAFAGVAALINVTPGLDTLLVLRTSVSEGRAAGHAAALGIVVGCLAWGVATAIGLTALVATSRMIYNALTVAGALYLTWLGVSALWRSRRRNADGTATALEDGAGELAGHSTAEQPTAPFPRNRLAPFPRNRLAPFPRTRLAPFPHNRLAAFRAGLATNLLNPKAGIFYLSLIPQFIPKGTPVFGATILLTAIDIAELAIWYWLISRVASTLGERIRRPSFRRRMEQVSGIAFLGFAVTLLAESV
ncbi:LysE family translocator [Streptomyces sp. NPDC002446]